MARHMHVRAVYAQMDETRETRQMLNKRATIQGSRMLLAHKLKKAQMTQRSEASQTMHRLGVMNSNALQCAGCGEQMRAKLAAHTAAVQRDDAAVK